MNRFLTACAFLACFVSSAFAALPDAPATPPVPPVPAPPQTPFSDEVAGRKLLFAARDFYHGAKPLDFSVKGTITNTNGPQRPPAVASTVSESVLFDGSAKRFAFSTSTVSGNRRTVRKALSDGENLIVTRFEEQTGANAAKPVREVVRFSAGDASMPRIFAAAQYAPFSQAGLFAAGREPVSPQSRIAWLQGTQKIGNAPADVVCETDFEQGKNEEVTRARRYFLDKAHRILRFEEWTTRQNAPKPARKNTPADNGVRVQYRRETYTYASGEAAKKSAAYALGLPDNYEEKPTPELPPPAAPPSQADPKAVALLSKWQESWERFLSYSAQAEVSVQTDARTEISRPVQNRQNNAVRYGQVIFRRPDARARIVQEPSDNQERRGPRTLTIVSDGKQVRGVSEGGRRGGSRTVPLDNARQLWQRINQTGYADRTGNLGGLSYVFLVPVSASDADTITYNGQASLDGGEIVNVVTLTKNTINTDKRSGEQTETVTTWRIGLDTTDNLPRLIETRRISTISGRFERDQPPITTITTRLRRVLVDKDPPPQAFVLP